MPPRNRFLPGLASAACTLGLALGPVGCTDDETGRGEATDEVADDSAADAFELQVGDCLGGGPAVTGEVSEVPVVPCDQPHDSEVFHGHTIDGDVMPDPTAMEVIVAEQCYGANFQTFVGLPHEQSTLQIGWAEPTTASWNEGDRQLLCIVTDPAGGVTGSLQGAAR